MNFALVYPGEKTRFAITATLAILFWILVILGTLGLALIYVLFIFIGYCFAQSAFISYLRGSAVKITPEQFPDLHARVAACCDRLGMTIPPDAYLMHADGIFNALATKFLGRNYIVLYTSVVDALDERPEALNFYIGHELGHIHRKHLNWAAPLAPVAWLPLLGAALRRAEEYTCDRYGLKSCASVDDAKAGLAALAAGHSRWGRLNYAAYAEQRHAVTGFWASFHEFTGDYPWTAKRAHAIEELASGREPRQPSRNFFAGLLALLVPRIPGLGGGGGLIMLILVIGILAAIAVPAYQDYVQRAALVPLGEKMSYGREALEGYAMARNEWPAAGSDLEGFESEFQLGPVSVTAEVASDGQLVYVLNGSGLDDATLTHTPQPIIEEEQLKAIEWSCSADGIKPAAIPEGCQ